jgi:transcriptional regulator with XRE-family HTH domain
MEKRERVVAVHIATETRRARAERGWSQAALAERLDLSTNYISLLERAERMPSVEVLARLAAALGTSASALVGEAPTADAWLVEATTLLATLSETARPIVLGMLRAASDASAPAKKTRTSSVPRKRR